jgi:hypothetical protein
MTVLVLGAGATKAVGGPLTREILHDAITLPNVAFPSHLDTVDQFLIENFHLPPDRAARSYDDYPNLPALLSLIDLALDRKQPFSPAWGTDRLGSVRAALEYAIFALIDERLKQNPTNEHYHLFQKFGGANGATVISLNYDIVADNSLIAVGAGTFPDYAVDTINEMYRAKPARVGKLLKLHGSINWLYCPNCHDLDFEIADSTRMMAPDMLLFAKRRQPGVNCERCPSVRLQPILITPTFKKDYRNPHIAQLWYRAERELRQAERVIFIGYSLPDDDVEVVYLLKRAIRPGTMVTVVEWVDEAKHPERVPLAGNDVGRRYRALFGPGIDWNADGLVSWINRQP